MWKVIKEPNLKYKYEVSNTGRVRRPQSTVKKKHENGTTYESIVPAQEMTPVDNGLGYLQVKLSTNKNSQKAYYVHELVLKAFNPTTRTDVEVSHKDNNKSNNNLGNLEWLTKSENQTKMAKENPHIVNNLKK